MIENNKVYEILLKSVRTNGNKNDPRRIHIDEQIKNLKESIIMYGHTLYELHNPEHILYILDKIPSFVNALNAVYDSPHPHISDMGLSLAVAKISDEIKQNTKGNTNSLNKDIHSTLMDAFNLLIDAVASCKVVPRNDVSIISSIQQIQRRLNELEIDLIQGLPDINYSGMRPDLYNERPNPDGIKSLLGALPSGTGNTQSSENEGYKPGLYKSNDIKKFVSNVNELYPVKLKYNDKTYYIDSELTNKASTKCVRMFDENGMLVGYMEKDGITIDSETESIMSEAVILNDNNKVHMKNIFMNVGLGENKTSGGLSVGNRTRGGQRNPNTPVQNLGMNTVEKYAFKPNEQIKVDITKEFIKVVLEYNNNVYLAENKIFKHMSAYALRMFDTNGYLVGYIFKDARCTDLPLITFSSVTVVNASDADIVKALYDLAESTDTSHIMLP